MNAFNPTHRITCRRSNGTEETFEVQADMNALDDGGCPLYTRAEWESSTDADWEYSPASGLTFHGRSGPYNNTEYFFNRIATREEALELAEERLRAAERAINEYQVPVDSSPDGEFERPVPTESDVAALKQLQTEHEAALAHYRACSKAARSVTAPG